MGRIRTAFVKRIAEKLMIIHKDKFTTNFDENKQKVAEKTDVSTKKLRNLIAGYITKKVKISED